MLRRHPADKWAGSLLPLLLLAAALSVAHTVATPAFWPVDETSHIAYADHLFRVGSLPTIDDPIPPDLPYPGLSNRLGWEQRENRPGREDIWTANHPPLPYLFQGLGLQVGLGLGNGALAVLLARLTSTVWLLLAVWLTVRLAEVLLPGRRRSALAAGAMVATTPTLVHLSGLVFNDVAGLAASTAVLLAGALIVRDGPTPRRLVQLGLLCGGAALVRVSCLPAVVAAVAMAAFAAWHHRPVARRRRPQLLRPALIGAAALLPAAAFYLRNLLTYGDIGAKSALFAKFGRDLNDPVGDLVTDRSFWLRLWNRLFGDLTTGHWSTGEHTTFTELLLFLAIFAILWVAVVGMVRGVGPRFTRAQQRMAVTWACCLVLPAALLVTTVQFHSSGGSLHGRYLLGGHAVLAILVAGAIGALPRLGRHTLWIIVVPLLLTGIALLGVLLDDPNHTWLRNGVSLHLRTVTGPATTAILWLVVFTALRALYLLQQVWVNIPPDAPLTITERPGRPQPATQPQRRVPVSTGTTTLG